MCEAEKSIHGHLPHAPPDERSSIDPARQPSPDGLVSAAQYSQSSAPRHPGSFLPVIQPAIEATTYTGDRTAGKAAFVDAVARKNVELTPGNIRRNSTVIAELEKAGTVKIAGAFYDCRRGPSSSWFESNGNRQ